MAVAPFAPTLSELAIDAWERVGKKAGELSVTHLMSMRRSMNFVQVRWANRGINLWEVAEVTVPLIAEQGTYAVATTVIDMLDGFRRVIVAGGPSGISDTPMTPIGRGTYAALSQKTTPGAPILYWFDRLITPTVTLWPVPDATATYEFHYYAFSQIPAADPSGANAPTVPYRFLEAYTAALAAHLALKWAPAQRAVALDAAAKEAWEEASDEDREKVSLSMVPDMTPYMQ